MLKQRIITAVLLAPLLLAIVLYGNQDLFAVLIVVIQSAAIYEWLKINRLRSGLAVFNAVIVSIFTLFVSDKLYVFDQMHYFDTYQLSRPVLMVVYLIVWFFALVWLRRHQWGYQNSSFQLVAKSTVGVMAIMLFAICMYQLYFLPSGRWWTLALFLLIWVADIGAYISGKTMGKHKLAINISPKKTWEGVIGAQALVAVYAVVISYFMGVSWQKALLIMIPVALFSVVGDLVASLGKRQASVKDSSNLLPGHGGFIDRFDSLIAASPLFFFLLVGL